MHVAHGRGAKQALHTLHVKLGMADVVTVFDSSTWQAKKSPVYRKCPADSYCFPVDSGPKRRGSKVRKGFKDDDWVIVVNESVQLKDVSHFAKTEWRHMRAVN